MENYITCTEGTFPEIDFAENSLLLASGSASNEVSEITSSFYQNSDNQYTLNVKVLLGFTMMPGTWSIHIVVSKLPENAQTTNHKPLFLHFPKFFFTFVASKK